MRKTHGWAVLTVAMLLGSAACGGGDGADDKIAGPLLGDSAIKAAEVVARAEAFRRPIDAAPSPDGTLIYFSATGDQGSAVFRVPAGGGDVATLSEGGPLARPTGVAVATDGSRVYVADQQSEAAGTGGAGAGAGAILTIPATDGPAAATPLPGTEGRSPRGLDVTRPAGGDADVIYFTGTDPADGSRGLFRVPAAGGEVTTVADGPPFLAPDSVVVAADGVAYVSDLRTGSGQGQVLRVAGGSVTPVLTGLHLGAPAGVTLVDDDATLLVSSIDPITRSDQVLFLDLATGRTDIATDVIGTNKDSSGGLHRARNAPVLAWADVRPGGRVYRVDL